jgi:hypothetical protein
VSFLPPNAWRQHRFSLPVLGLKGWQVSTAVLKALANPPDQAHLRGAVLISSASPLRVRAGLACGLGAALLCCGCASRGSTPPPAWAGQQTQLPGAVHRAPPPPISPETDPENVESRFGFTEAKARREHAAQNSGQGGPGFTTAAQTVVPLPQGSPAPVPQAAPQPPPPPAPQAKKKTPDGGARDGGTAPSRR